ncbi:MAG: UPF0147 family protein [Nanoarchaeota archaeon]
MENQEIDNIIEALIELKEDISVQKNIKNRISGIIEMLSDLNKDDLSIKINKALDELDQISNENNIHSYIRTQIWNIVSMLEMLEC